MKRISQKRDREEADYFDVHTGAVEQKKARIEITKESTADVSPWAKFKAKVLGLMFPAPQVQQVPLKDYMKRSKTKFSLGYLPVDDHEIQGLDKLASELRGMFDRAPKNMQETLSLVVQNASGVGKTFSSLAVYTLLNKADPTRFHLPLYLGFGHGFGFTGPELEVLEGPNNAYERVASVVGRRLLHQLQALVDLCDQTNQDIERVVKTPQHKWLAKIPLPAGDMTFSSEVWFPLVMDIDEDPLIVKCAELLGRLSAHCGDKKLALLLIIDEGQFLDEFAKPDNNSGGARSALRFARRLQLCVAKRGLAAVAPLMTGIDPVTSLRNHTTGANKVYSDPLLSRNEFELALKVEFGTKYQMESPTVFYFAASLYYPVLRDANFSLRHQTVDILSVPDEIAPMLLLATCGKHKLSRKHWHTEVPARFEMDRFVPEIPYYQFRAIFNKLEDCFIYKAIQPFDLEDMKVDLGKLGKMSRRWHDAGFEELAFDVLTILMALANVAPAQEDFEDYNGVPAAKIFKSYEACRESMWKRSGWLQTSFKRFPGGLPSYSTEASNHFLPSGNFVTHADAFALDANGNPKCAMLEKFREELKTHLLEAGDCRAIVCGGRAPIDYIWVIRKSAQGVSPVDVEVCFADAKQRVDTISPSEKGMPEKLLLVANFLEAALRVECGMRVVKERFAIITNGTPVGTDVYIATNRVAQKHGKAVDGGVQMKKVGETMVCAAFKIGSLNVTECEPVQMLSPTTFSFPPLTDLLYGPIAKQKKKNNGLK